MPASGPLHVDLSGRTAVVTGSTRGIGRAITEALLASGASVIGLQRGTEPLGPGHTCVSVDLSDPAARSEVAAQVLAEHEVDILVNNAGINLRHRFEDFPLEEFSQVMQVNLDAVVQLTQELGRPMLERGHGRIITVASMLSFFGGLNASAYAASKGAVAQLTKSVANEWAGRGVAVNAVAPGFIATELNTSLQEDPVRNAEIVGRIPAGRWGRGEDIAGTVLFLTSDGAEYVHGAVLPVDGGYLAR
ncbi:SDR family oxidoreductase [Brachybacterium sp. YJGR34]|uniref:SDR family oxidoreductase n=1 Tax=Brachybacterium sp. YJGR34 TaxID=2059911 RepID=UPI000E0B50BF|nr:SDR family oxidoreductase [Brachybacterium sp. YJGR34]